jgi:hypothetical protein
MTDEEIAALSDEEKRIWTETFLRMVDKSQPDTQRQVVRIGTDDDGSPLHIVTWKKPNASPKT